jgi:c-di-GMP-binding flagellar brake protein YcgR
MESKRKDYRHNFPADERIPVDLELSGARTVLHGEIVNLSVGGMRVHFVDSVADLNPQGRLVARASIRESKIDLALASTVIYAEQSDDASYCGLRFLPSASRTIDESTERIVWSFLLDEQRRLRRRQKESVR